MLHNEYSYKCGNFQRTRLTFKWNSYFGSQTFPQKIKQLVKTQLTASHLTNDYLHAIRCRRTKILPAVMVNAWLGTNRTKDSQTQKFGEPMLGKNWPFDLNSVACWSNTKQSWIMLFMDKWIVVEEKIDFLWFD